MNKNDFMTIVKICERAESMGINWGNRLTGLLDIENAHKEFNLRLDEFLTADDANFAHDFIGIQNNINRKTFRMENCFVPRFSSAD